MADETGTLFLKLIDVFSHRIKDHADILLTHQVLTDRRVVRNVDTSKRIKIPNLNAVPQGLYRLEVDPLGYMPVSLFVNVESGDGTELELPFAVDPTKVRAVQFPEYGMLPERVQALLQSSSNVLGYPNKAGPELYAALDDTRKAGFLNIVAKCAHTALVSSMPVTEYLQQLNECRGDRFFARVTQQLREDTSNSIANGHFFEVPELLHHPPVGFESAKSFKTDDHYGNLQLSFFTNGTDWVADIDIDNANGLEHVFQVARNALTQRPTHPYDIHEILVFYQKIDPGYRLVV
jgi:hypothetical protein